MMWVLKNENKSSGENSNSIQHCSHENRSHIPERPPELFVDSYLWTARILHYLDTAGMRIAESRR